MTPSDLIDIAKRRYNATDDSFFPQAELLDMLTEAQKELSTHGLVIEKVDSSVTTVDGTRSYSFPTRFMSIYRIEYDGKKLIPMTFRIDDSMTLSDVDTTEKGEPAYYAQWDEKIYLRPVPDAAQTLKIFGYAYPAEPTITDTDMDIPTEFQSRLIYYMLKEMAAKDNNWSAADRYQALWDNTVEEAKKWQRRRLRSDAPAMVVDVDSLPSAIVELGYFRYGGY